jgi:phosphatidylinositol alpha-1,6-mannosyltransferase
MKILIVSVDFPPHTDGVSTVAHELATRLTETGEEVIVIGPKDRGDFEYDYRQKFKVYRSPLYELGYLRILPLLFLIPYVIIRYRPRYVIPMNIAYGGIVAYLLHRALGFSYSMWAYGYEFAKFENKALVKDLYLKIYAEAKFIAAITVFVKDRLVKFGVRADKIIIVKPGTDPQRYYPFKVVSEFLKKYDLENKKVVLSVGRLVERKGVDMTIRALKDVVERVPNVTYAVVGTGPFSARLEEIARQEGMSNYLRFCGRVKPEELAMFYNACDCLIMASRTLDKKGDVEGYGIVYLEANACQKPVIGGRDGGMSEAIEEGKTGLLVNSSCPKDIAQALIRLLTDKEYAEILGRNGRLRVVNELNWDRAIRLFHENLKQKCAL